MNGLLPLGVDEALDSERAVSDERKYFGAVISNVVCLCMHGERISFLLLDFHLCS